MIDPKQRAKPYRQTHKLSTTIRSRLSSGAKRRRAIPQRKHTVISLADPTLQALNRELDELLRAVHEDNDQLGRDHWPEGRWPMIHNLAKRIDALSEANP